MGTQLNHSIMEAQEQDSVTEELHNPITEQTAAWIEPSNRTLQAHYWRPKPQSILSLQWCVPSNFWPRGRWGRPHNDEPSSGTTAVFRNTFIEVSETGALGTETA